MFNNRNLTALRLKVIVNVFLQLYLFTCAVLQIPKDALVYVFIITAYICEFVCSYTKKESMNRFFIRGYIEESYHLAQHGNNTATANESHFQCRFAAVFAFVIQSLSHKSVISCCCYYVERWKPDAQKKNNLQSPHHHPFYYITYQTCKKSVIKFRCFVLLQFRRLNGFL